MCNVSYRSRGLSARTSSLALKAHCAFNFEQAQRIEVISRALCSSKSSIRKTHDLCLAAVR
ncbi:hypothetical protein [Gardnerella vaginalis]|uniref:hypothetical protein n=1 Tax=Gardnerella vaginalis TaxID=2702 RepID=UPI0009BF7AC4|nr:hypothetical protein [Gardnerella vaginalis]PKY96974.1 hypothetical protein CYJ58_02665 [Gardnerella vaginalis]